MDYYIGLDIGTDSVGWAVANTDYTIPKFKGNSMWGIRLLEESNTAKECRTFRGQRRRTERKKFRIQCLQMLFDKEISKKDMAFYQRLAESNLYQEDKSSKQKFSVFNDKDYTDKDYHNQYPTIYHLRKELIESKDEHDVRLVYLALSHIIKNRGHFLFDSAELGKNGLPDFESIWNELCDTVNDFFEDVDISLDNTNELKNILKAKTTKSFKKKSLFDLFNINEEPVVSILTLLSGGTVQLAKMFNDELLSDIENKSMTFSAGYDEKASDYEDALGDRFILIEKLKAIYDWGILANILCGEQYISFAKCNIYDKHRSDLILLKKYVKEYCPEKYSNIFAENKKGINNYLAYSGHCSGGAIENTNCSSQEDFCSFLKSQLPKHDGFEEMFADIEAGTFMPKIVCKNNSVIPMQVNKAELEEILKNASEYLPFLTEKDEDGKTVSEKIIDIFSYRIPYYVGPLNNHSKRSWVVREKGKIYPWNFKDVVDVDKSAEAFIDNLTSKCTYIKTEDVLPKSSLLYSKFMVLDELNNLKVDGEPISVELKQKIYNDLFLHKSKVTQKALENYLKSFYAEDFYISGIDGDFKSNLKSHMDFASYDLSIEEKEEIIKAITIFGDDKKMLECRLKQQFSSKLSNDEIRNICKLKYSGWGRMSKKFLKEIKGENKDTKEINSIIDFMWNTNNNHMELLSKNYSFIDVINELNSDMFEGLKQEVDSLYVSPKVKRPIFQSMLIVEELVKIKKQPPKKIFIEVARESGEKKRTKTRKDILIDLYKSCKQDYPDLYEKINSTDKNEFRRDALYLYYTQFGKCMYSGEDIELSEIYNKNIYDIDHIYPQSKIKDDSIDNRVLVKKTFNMEKSNVYPISQSIRDKRSAFWKMLFDKKLISKKKYDRLVRNIPLTDDELNSFINRQLVETRQSTKAVAELLRKRYPDSKIVYVKAGFVSDFRQKYDLIKCREVNDFHHAKDAYLNIVEGNVYDTKFTSRFFISELQSGKSSLNRMYDYNIEGAWKADNNETLKLVKTIMNKNNIRFTRYSSMQKGGLFDQNILKKGQGQVPIKKNSPRSNIEKYGGYNRATSTYFAFVEYLDKKNKPVRSFIPIDLYEEKEYVSNPEHFIKDRLDSAKNIKIIIPCVKYNSLISVDGFRMHISSKSGGGLQLVCKSAVQLVLGYNYERYIKYVSSYLKKCKEYKQEKVITEWDHISSEENIELYKLLIEKLTNTIFNVRFGKLAISLSANLEKFESLSVHDQCFVIMQIIKVLHANVETGDLTLIGEAKKSGLLTISSKIQPNIKELKLINQSITGLFEQEIDLLK